MMDREMHGARLSPLGRSTTNNTAEDIDCRRSQFSTDRPGVIMYHSFNFMAGSSWEKILKQKKSILQCTLLVQDDYSSCVA